MQQRTNTAMAGALLLVMALTIFFFASQIEQRIPIGVDSGFFPEVAAVLLGVLAAIILVQGLRTNPDLYIEQVAPPGRRAVAMSLFLLIAFGAAMATVGFLPATVGYLLAQFFVLSPPDQRRPLMFVAIAVGAAVVIQLIFTRGFGLALPIGLWG